MAEPARTPWRLCHHLQSAEKDAACGCGYRGGIWGGDDNHLVCEMGSTEIKGEEGLSAPRYPRPVELANAALIVRAVNTRDKALAALRQARATLKCADRSNAWQEARWAEVANLDAVIAEMEG